MTLLYSIRYSPWSLRAKWALAYHDSEYTNSEFIPSLSNLTVRCKTGNYCGKLTLPVMIDQGGRVLMDSLEISKWSSLNKGPNSKGDLFAGVDSQQLEEWQAHADQIMSYCRSQFFEKIVNDDEALKFMLPSFAQKLGWVGLMMGKRAVKKTKDKYKNEPGTNNLELARKSLVSIREALSKGNGEYLAGQFSYADVLASVALHMVSASEKVFPFKKAMQKAMRSEQLEEEFKDLLVWRDKIVEKHYFNIKTGKYD